jgi:hypothetical protein
MGGNALKAYGARRVTAAEAKKVAVEVCQVVDAIFLERGFDRKSHMIQAYRQKTDYGDLDIVVLEEAVRAIGMETFLALVAERLGKHMPTVQNHPNAGHVSAGYPLGDGSCLQIDFMFANAAEYDFSCEYFGWNDLGNIMTVLAKKMDKLKFGHAGLTSVFKEGGHILGTVFLTQNFEEAVRFLGYDYNRYAQGFDTLEEIYEFAANNPYFNPDIYLLENRNHDARMRDKKRSTYSGFLKWMAEHPVPRYEWPEKGDWVEKALQAFPEAVTQMTQMSEAERKRRTVKSIYNGSLVSKVTGLQHTALGPFMETFKKHCGEVGFDDFILATASDDLAHKMLDFQKTYVPKPAIKPEAELSL